jgi:hypothetical protein
MARAIELGQKARQPEPAQLYLEAARIHAQAAKDQGRKPRDSPWHLNQALEYLRRAYVLGAPLPDPRQDPLLGPIREQLQTKGLPPRQRTTPDSPLSTWLVAPSLPEGMD